MTQRALELGILAIQQQSLTEGARLIRIALKSGDLLAEMRAIAYLWLAETQTDTAHKRACYTEALHVDPNNAEARSRLSALLTAGLPTSTPATGTYTAATSGGTGNNASGATAPTSFNVADYLARVIDGPNGVGTAVFITQEGLLATTRRVVGGLERVTIETYAGGQVYGTVVRAYTDLDLAFISINQRPAALLPVTPMPRVPDDDPLTVVSYDGEVTRAQQRPTRRAMAAHWIPTSITQLTDAGGDVIFDEKNYLVGIMTKATSLASGATYYGIHIAMIRRLAEVYLRDARSDRRRYCPDCGNASRATGTGYFYCEQCGASAPEARTIPRYVVPQAALFYEPTGKAACSTCNANAGIYNNRCLRCGAEQR